MTRPAHNYAPWPCEADPAWKIRATQAMREASAMLDRIPSQQRDIGDPNHPMHDGLFGESRAAFLSRQYR